MEKKVTKIDQNGRITIPIEFRKFFPDAARVNWIFDGKKLLVYFEGDGGEIEFVTIEYIINQMNGLRSELDKLKFTIEEIRKMVLGLIRSPDG